MTSAAAVLTQLLRAQYILHYCVKHRLSKRWQRDGLAATAFGQHTTLHGVATNATGAAHRAWALLQRSMGGCGVLMDAFCVM